MPRSDTRRVVKKEPDMDGHPLNELCVPFGVAVFW